MDTHSNIALSYFAGVTLLDILYKTPLGFGLC